MSSPKRQLLLHLSEKLVFKGNTHCTVHIFILFFSIIELETRMFDHTYTSNQLTSSSVLRDVRV